MSTAAVPPDRLEKRGPKLGDAASLWNFTPSPGWTKEEAAILKLCLMKYGVGRWVNILETGLLPGKLIQQLNGQTQRLIGQQSLAACTGLQVDIDRIRADNEQREDVERKGGLIIWSGPNPTKRMKDEWQRECQARYGLSPEQLAEVDAQLEELAASSGMFAAGSHEEAGASRMPFSDLMGASLEELSREQKLLLLQRLRAKLASLVAALTAKEAGAPVTKVQGTPVKQRPVLAAQRSTQNAVSEAAAAARGLPGRGPKACAKRRSGAKQSRESEEGRDPKRRSKGGGKGKGKDSCSGELAEAERAATDADLTLLQGMGFEKVKAQEALEECGYRVDAAANWLLIHCT